MPKRTPNSGRFRFCQLDAQGNQGKGHECVGEVGKWHPDEVDLRKRIPEMTKGQGDRDRPGGRLLQDRDEPSSSFLVPGIGEKNPDGKGW